MTAPDTILPYAPPPQQHRNTPGDILRRAALWTVLCGVSAAPSFMWATRSFDELAMLTGIVMFICFYTIFTSTPAFLTFRDRPFVRRTLYIGYGTRLAISIIFPVGMIIDLIPGLISVSIVSGSPTSHSGFFATLLITIIQGTFINAILSVYMLFIWAMQRAFCKLPQEYHGFPVETDSPPQ